MMRKVQFYTAVLLLILLGGVNQAFAIDYCYEYDAKTKACQVHEGLTFDGRTVTALTQYLDTKDLCAAKYTLPECVDAPTATNVTITGDPSVGQVLTGTYTFTPDGAEGTSTFKWYSGSDTSCTEKLQVGSEKTYTTVATDKDKYICFEVTPVDTNNIAGTAVMSAGVQITGCAEVIINWANPADITTGTALSDTQLNATIQNDIPGTLSYTPTAGTVLTEGDAQNLTVHFVPYEPAKFCPPADKTVLINVKTSSCTAALTTEPAATADTVTLAAPNQSVTFTDGTTNTASRTWTIKDASGNSVATSTDKAYTYSFATAGTYTVSLMSKDSTGCTTPAKTVTVNVGASSQPTYTSSTALNGTLTMSSCTSANIVSTLTVTNTGTAALNITSITLGGANKDKFTVSPSAALTIAGGKNQAFTITGNGSTAGNFVGTLEIAHNAAGSPAKYNLSSVIKDCAVPTYNTYVAPINKQPIGDRAYISTVIDKPIALTLTGYDPDADFFSLLIKPLAYSVVTQPANGTLSGTAPNLTYTPKAGFVGTDFFTFKISDLTSDSAPATVSVIVHPNSNVSVSEKYEMDVFCAEYQGAKYGFRLKYNPIAADPSGLYWRMDTTTLGKAYIDTKSCIPVGNDLKIVIPSALYNGTTYQFTLNNTPVQGDPYGFYWKMDLSTFK